MTPTALTIAGSDSGGGAGIQADLKAFSALGVYGCSAVAALTAQNTVGVQGILAVDPAFVAMQIDSVFADIRVDAVKIGMLGGASVIAAVADALERHRLNRGGAVVLDPVMVAKSGDRLLHDDAVTALRERLLPLSTLITPNLPEAAVLLDEAPVTERRAMAGAAARLQGLGCPNVLLKGGHLEGEASPDLLMHGGELLWFEGGRIATPNTHGTGCTLSSAVAALLARGLPLPAAVGEAKRYLEGAIRAGADMGIGHGHGPVHHFHRLWPHLAERRTLHEAQAS
ncbi:MAG: bifunctional hydroxymethylpyrimidine kinase/phosphomethylpyrimidine kinase [Geminicoccaceae bacterium]|nr:bifunctional hydroxymethylpyrimidine kinase/phosphomethylpyrimidine kinase [Geminicoccaceae bacterium]